MVIGALYYSGVRHRNHNYVVSHRDSQGANDDNDTMAAIAASVAADGV